MLLRALKRCFKALFLLSLTLGVGVVLVFIFPNLLVHDSSLPWLGRLLRAYEIPVSWKVGHWTARSLSLWNKMLEIHLDGVCYTVADPYLKVCGKQVDLAVSYDLKTHYFEIHKLHILEGDLISEARSHASPAQSEPSSPLQMLHEVRDSLESLHWKDIQIKEFAVMVASQDSTLRLKVDATGAPPKAGALLQLQAHGHWLQKGARKKVHAEIAVTVPETRPLQYKVQLALGEGRQRFELRTKGDAHASHLKGQADFDFPPYLKSLQSISARNCAYSWDEAESQSHFSFHCPVGLTSLRRENVVTHLQASADVDSSGKTLTTVRVSLDEFHSLVRTLRWTPWAVPAPFNQLRGAVQLSASSALENGFSQDEVGFDLKTELKSHFQRLHLDGQGHFSMKKETSNLDLELAFNDTRLALPNLDPTHLPRLFPDSEIEYPDQEAKSETSAFSYRLHFFTPPGKAVYLYSPQLGADIPLHLDLSVPSLGSPTGYLRIVDFPVHFLRREGLVKKAMIRFPKEGVAVLDAELDFHYTDYDLTLEAFGPLDSPRFSLNSNPPLSENSALSLLLFGRPLEELSPGQGESLASARAAITNGAISALSMYLLASTPIESIGYDPNQGRFSATVRVGQGTSLLVEGQKEGVQSVGLRRRLGRNWVLNTTVERSSQSDEHRSVSTFLEWSKSY